MISMTTAIQIQLIQARKDFFEGMAKAATKAKQLADEIKMTLAKLASETPT
jgi:hypothetical protein